MTLITPLLLTRCFEMEGMGLSGRSMIHLWGGMNERHSNFVFFDGTMPQVDFPIRMLQSH
jgi:hypothetical protein